ncbi:MAG TPA: TolC family protein [Longimicrobium sp.]|nr:TolC family protein [Longimicrobium sp.]
MKAFSLFAALAVAAAPAAAQTGQDSMPLSLGQAQRIAAENNPQYRRAQTELGTAEADLRRARGAFLPTVSASLGARGGFSRRFTGQDQFGKTVVRDDPLESPSSSASQSLALGGVTLFDGGERQRERRAAQAGYQVTEARIGSEEVRVRGEVERRYWEAVRTSQAIALEQALLKSARDRLESTRALLRVGVRGPIDVLGAEVTVADQEQALEKAGGDARRAQLDLRQSMGVLEGPPLALTDAPPAPFDPAVLDVSALVARAISNHPRVARVQAAEQQAEHRLSAAQSSRWPRLTMGATVGRSQFHSNYSGLVQVNPLDQAAGLNFDLRIPLFSQYQTSYQIQSARASRDAAREDSRAERLTVERDVRVAVVELQNAHTAALQSARALDLNRRRLDLAQQQYRVGALTLMELTDAVERAARAERDALRTRFEFAAALATLDERVGGRVAP